MDAPVVTAQEHRWFAHRFAVSPDRKDLNREASVGETQRRLSLFLDSGLPHFPLTPRLSS
jgi:hypothetical protein